MADNSSEKLYSGSSGGGQSVEIDNRLSCVKRERKPPRFLIQELDIDVQLIPKAKCMRVSAWGVDGHEISFGE